MSLIVQFCVLHFKTRDYTQIRFLRAGLTLVPCLLPYFMYIANSAPLVAFGLFPKVINSMKCLPDNLGIKFLAFGSLHIAVSFFYDRKAKI